MSDELVAHGLEPIHPRPARALLSILLWQLPDGRLFYWIEEGRKRRPLVRVRNELREVGDFETAQVFFNFLWDVVRRRSQHRPPLRNPEIVPENGYVEPRTVWIHGSAAPEFLPRSWETIVFIPHVLDYTGIREGLRAWATLHRLNVPAI